MLYTYLYMKILTTRHFYKWAKKQKVSLEQLSLAAVEVLNEHYEADLGGHIIKKRVGTHNKGKRGGIRTIIFFCKGDKLIYIHGFQKNEKSNISQSELKMFKGMAKIFDAMTDQQFDLAIKKGSFVKVIS